MRYFRYVHDVGMAWESIRGSKLRSGLTALGIIFGVAAVISMLAIGGGAKKEILAQLRRVGVNNVVVESLEFSGGDLAQPEEEGAKEGREHRRFSPGLTLRDAFALRGVLPSVRYISPEIEYEVYAQSGSIRSSCQLVGVHSDYFSIYNLPLAQGRFFSDSLHRRSGVCVIGSEVRARLFGRVPPLGQRLRVGSAWFEVIGVLARGGSGRQGDGALGISSYDFRIFVGAESLGLRFRRRGVVVGGEPSSWVAAHPGASEVDRIVMQVVSSEEVGVARDVAHRLLLRRHQGVEDFRIVVPEELLRQQQRTKDIFNLVLGLIAGISLLVGGIGIMNIMFSSVVERTKEIGTRLAIGAKRADVVVQFLSEAVFISVSGGAVGVVFGVAFSVAIERVAGIETVVTMGAIAISFFVSVAVGIVFGYAPARRAAMRSPIESLRYE